MEPRYASRFVVFTILSILVGAGSAYYVHFSYDLAEWCYAASVALAGGSGISVFYQFRRLGTVPAVLMGIIPFSLLVGLTSYLLV